MAFLRAEKKASGTYLRIVQSYKIDGKAKHKTLYSLGKIEDYSQQQLERIAHKILALAGGKIEDIISTSLKEIGRYNYGYSLVIQHLYKSYDFSTLVRKINNNSRIKFNWQAALNLMLAERLNEPCSKRQNNFHQNEYIGLSRQEVPLHHFYRTLDLLSEQEVLIKKHLFTAQQNIFTTVLDVVFYDVTTIYFESQEEKEGTLRQKGYSKDGKAHKTQIVLGLLVDKLRNPISYQIYEGNTYEGGTMIDALNNMRQQFNIDRVIVVADSAMIDKTNRAFMHAEGIDYILGDTIKKLSTTLINTLLDKSKHTAISATEGEIRTYREISHQGRRIICTYSSKRARKDAHERQKLIDKAKLWLAEPSKYKQVKKRGAGRFINTDEQGQAMALNIERIEQDAKFDGFKAIATTTTLKVETVLSKYSDLFEVEHSFRTLKSQLEIRPIFHWTDKRIRGHIAMCFIAFTFLNHLRNTTGLQHKELVRAMDKMQLSHIEDCKAGNTIYLRSAITSGQQTLIDTLKLKIPNDTTPQSTINQSLTI